MCECRAPAITIGVANVVSIDIGLQGGRNCFVVLVPLNKSVECHWGLDERGDNIVPSPQTEFHLGAPGDKRDRNNFSLWKLFMFLFVARLTSLSLSASRLELPLRVQLASAIGSTFLARLD